jgi:hypothetical protein
MTIKGSEPMKKSLKRIMIVIAAIMILISICCGCAPTKPGETTAPTTEPEVTHGEDTQPVETVPETTHGEEVTEPVWINMLSSLISSIIFG